MSRTFPSFAETTDSPLDTKNQVCPMYSGSCTVPVAGQERHQGTCGHAFVMSAHSSLMILPAARTFSMLFLKSSSSVDLLLASCCNALTALNQVFAEAIFLGLVVKTAGIISARGNLWRMAFSAFSFTLLAALASKKFQMSCGTTGLAETMSDSVSAPSGLYKELGGAPKVIQSTLSGSLQLSCNNYCSYHHMCLVAWTVP